MEKMGLEKDMGMGSQSDRSKNSGRLGLGCPNAGANSKLLFNIDL